MTGYDTHWIVRMKPNPGAAIRLFCFPYAGGGASVYRRWALALPDFVEVCAVQLPGRESRFREEPCGRMDELVPALCEGLSHDLDKPYAFFGHSMGATVCFELARQVRRMGLPGPRLLLVSGAGAPQWPQERPPLHGLPDAAFWAAVAGLHGVSAEVAANADLRQLLTPMLRADFAVCERYRCLPEPPLQSPITALGGRADGTVSPARLAGWAAQTLWAFRLHLVAGDHFFVNTACQAVLGIVTQEIEALGFGRAEQRATAD